MQRPKIEVAIVGAGIVGVAIALQLQNAGIAVALVEPNEPGIGTAAGSAGYLSDSEIFPLARPTLLAEIPKMLANPLGPLVIRPSYAPRMLGYAMRFLVAMTPRRFERGVRALASLNRDALAALLALAERAGAADLLVRDGALWVYRTQAALDRHAADLPALHANGTAAERVGVDRLRELEPALAGDLAGAVYFPNEARCADPAEFGRRFAAQIARDGGVFVHAAAIALESQTDGSWRIRCSDGGSLDARQVVVAAGVWSGALLRRLGYRVPLEAQRGYHLMLPNAGVAMRRVVLFGEPHFCATPMIGGLRLAGTVEFAGLKTPPDYRRSDMLFTLASNYIPNLSCDGATRWMGFRPSFPDSLPSIGGASKHPNLHYCFGHEKLGLTQAGISARCVTALVTKHKPEIDLAPFRLERFSGRSSSYNDSVALVTS